MDSDSEITLETPRFPPRLADVFRQLRRGRHICRADGAVFVDLLTYEQGYSDILGALGYVLTKHPKGFFYIEGARSVSGERLHRLVATLLLLFLDFEERKFEQGRGHWVEVLTQQAIPIAELVRRLFESSPDRRVMLDKVGITRDNIRSTVLQPLDQYGIIELKDGLLRFRPSVYRFVDLFLDHTEMESPLNEAAIPVIPNKTNDVAPSESPEEDASEEPQE